VNKELVGLYWDIGRMIAERQTDASHGAAVESRVSSFGFASDFGLHTSDFFFRPCNFCRLRGSALPRNP
jgi:hypothetical protein